MITSLVQYTCLNRLMAKIMSISFYSSAENTLIYQLETHVERILKQTLFEKSQFVVSVEEHLMDEKCCCDLWKKLKVCSGF